MEKVIYATFGNNALDIVDNLIDDEEVTSNSERKAGKKKGTASTVQPIRDLNTLKIMRKFFLDEAEKTENQSKKIAAIRNHLLFIIGLNFGIRISDILNLTWGDFTADTITLKEQKTGKFNVRYVTTDVKQALQKYKEVLEYYNIEYNTTDKLFDMTTQNVIKTLKRAARKCGFEENIGTHTMRKTFSYWYLMNHKNDSRATTVLQELLNHSSGATTLKYAGISADENKEVFESMADFYTDVDSGTIQIVDDKMVASTEQLRELIKYAYILGKENSGSLEDDISNIDTLQNMLDDLKL